MQMRIGRTKKNWVAWAFFLPHFLGVACFTLLPMLRVLAGSFQSAVGGRWMGLQNYLAVLKNPAFRIAVSNTGKFIGVCIPILLAASLALALGLRALVWGSRGLRTAFLLPMAVPAASVVLVWKVLFHEQGLLNGVLAGFGAEVNWTAGLAGIPESVYEAAQVDGASPMQTFWHITLPNLRPAAYSITVLSLLNSFKVFREAWLVAGDYPHESMYLLQHLYNNWFRELDFDKIAAASVMTSLVVLALIGLLQRAWDKED